MRIKNSTLQKTIQHVEFSEDSVSSYIHILSSWRQKIAILIRMQLLNDIIKSRHGFKTAQKFHKFRVLIKTLNL